MTEFVLDLEEDLAELFRDRARSARVSLEDWLILSGAWATALGLPINSIYLRMPSVRRALQGVAWEVLSPLPHGVPSMSPHECIALVFLIGDVVNVSVAGNIAHVSLATHRAGKTGDKQIEVVDFHQVVVAPDLVQDVAKGQKVFALGRLEYSSDSSRGQSTRIACMLLRRLSPTGPASENTSPHASLEGSTSPSPEATA